MSDIYHHFGPSLTAVELHNCSFWHEFNVNALNCGIVTKCLFFVCSIVDYFYIHALRIQTLMD